MLLELLELSETNTRDRTGEATETVFTFTVASLKNAKKNEHEEKTAATKEVEMVTNDKVVQPQNVLEQ